MLVGVLSVFSCPQTVLSGSAGVFPVLMFGQGVGSVARTCSDSDSLKAAQRVGATVKYVCQLLRLHEKKSSITHSPC